jgi:hypothetical protein
MSVPVRPAHRADRLRRAWALIKAGKVKRLGGSRFRIAGTTQRVYDVDLSVDPPCYCLDMEYRGTAIKHNCKHTLAARLAGLDPALLGTIADWLDTETPAHASRER